MYKQASFHQFLMESLENIFLDACFRSFKNNREKITYFYFFFIFRSVYQNLHVTQLQLPTQVKVTIWRKVLVQLGTKVPQVIPYPLIMELLWMMKALALMNIPKENLW